MSTRCAPWPANTPAADLAGVADALTRRLREVTDEFLRVENNDRPDYLESIFAPPLAPGRADGFASIRNRRRRRPEYALSRLGLLLVREIFGDELVAEQPRLFARRLGGEAAQAG